MTDGWDASAQAWITDLGGTGDHSRTAVLDGPMRALALESGAADMLDVGCGEGRFCRIMGEEGLTCTGIDPTEALLEAARAADPQGTYLNARAEEMPFEDGQFGLVVSYLTLIDIPDAKAGLAEMARVLRPGGRLLIANLSAHATSTQIKSGGWQRHEDFSTTMTMRDYLEEYSYWSEWRGIRIRNWHRPAAFYISQLLQVGLQLVRYDEPRSTSENARLQARYNSVPYFHVMAWEKPE